MAAVINHDAADAVAAAAAGGGAGRVYHHHHHLPDPAAGAAVGGTSATSSQSPSPGLQVKVGERCESFSMFFNGCGHFRRASCPARAARWSPPRSSPCTTTRRSAQASAAGVSTSPRNTQRLLNGGTKVFPPGLPSPACNCVFPTRRADSVSHLLYKVAFSENGRINFDHNCKLLVVSNLGL